MTKLKGKLVNTCKLLSIGKRFTFPVSSPHWSFAAVRRLAGTPVRALGSSAVWQWCGGVVVIVRTAQKQCLDSYRTTFKRVVVLCVRFKVSGFLEQAQVSGSVQQQPDPQSLFWSGPERL